ncbi:SDR family NAD(P)-dependent oxidoreductase [Nocardioides gilvus]|uniref:SDR family NAD(P)-dependent oxidoreductase n=1 Tax=Nocardioides gilvus TaxID=1735589 RepID=UPI0013A54B57|nr:SDR family oxidoreductase [Nocardioides gilvus]
MPEIPDTPVALVTGGAGFIGSAIVERLQAEGHRVAVLDRESEYPVDLSDEESVRSAARQVLADHGRCDVIVHAAASFELAPLPDLRADLLRRVMAVNVESPIWLLQELSPGMSERGYGRVVFIVSDTFFNPPPVPDMLPYITSKGALIGAARSLARSLGPQGITVNCVAPGMTPPPGGGMGADLADVENALVEDVRQSQAIRRSLVPSDVSQVVAFLVRPEAEMMTGQTLCPDGGLVLR